MTNSIKFYIILIICSLQYRFLSYYKYSKNDNYLPAKKLRGGVIVSI